MRDWQALVREHLGSIGEKQTEYERIADELAGHLEEHYQHLRAGGISEELAFEQTHACVGDWRQLRREIISVNRERTMIDRVRQIWIPTLVTLVLSAAVLTILIWSGMQPLVWHPGEARGIIVYRPWLLFLPLAGAIGAYLSRRSQGRGWPVYLSGLSPALAWAVVFALVTPFAFFVNPAVAPSLKITSILAMVVSWVVLPGIALIIGVVATRMMKMRRADKT